MTEQHQPDLPAGWEKESHEEIATHGIGSGFLLFEEIGQSVRGTLRTFFKTRHGLAVAIELQGPPTALAFQTDEKGKRKALKLSGGDMVNLSLSGVDLERKIKRDLMDSEVGIQYTQQVVTKSGAMKQFRVVVFQNELPL